MHHIVKLFDCTAYWPFELKAQEVGVPLTVERDAGMLVCLVDQEDLNRAKIEASARLDLSEWDREAGSIGIGWNKKRWKSWPWAPYGIGSRVNALVPWRDVASNSLPFGAQLVFPKIDGFLEFRGVAYVADAFGSAQPSDRLDLFFQRPAGKFRRSMRCRVTGPWNGVDSNPTLGAQQALNKLRYEGANGDSLIEDGLFGANTAHALETWAAEHLYFAPQHIEARLRPNDPEIYFMLRESAEHDS